MERRGYYHRGAAPLNSPRLRNMDAYYDENEEGRVEQTERRLDCRGCLAAGGGGGRFFVLYRGKGNQQTRPLARTAAPAVDVKGSSVGGKKISTSRHRHRPTTPSLAGGPAAGEKTEGRKKVVQDGGRKNGSVAACRVRRTGVRLLQAAPLYEPKPKRTVKQYKGEKDYNSACGLCLLRASRRVHIIGDAPSRRAPGAPAMHSPVGA